MRVKYSILIALMITLLLMTACGSEEEKNAPTGMNPSEYILNSFLIPADFKENSKVTWTATSESDTKGSVAIDLVVPNPATFDTNSLVQGYVERAAAINKDAKISIEKLDIQIKDSSQIPVLVVNYVKSGQGFDGTGWSSPGIPPLEGITQDPNQSYPIQTAAPVEVPTAYP